VVLGFVRGLSRLFFFFFFLRNGQFYFAINTLEITGEIHGCDSRTFT